MLNEKCRGKKVKTYKKSGEAEVKDVKKGLSLNYYNEIIN